MIPWMPLVLFIIIFLNHKLLDIWLKILSSWIFEFFKDHMIVNLSIIDNNILIFI